MIEHYKLMKLIRVFEEALCPYIENGEIKTPCHLYIGQEAIAVGICSQLKNSDLIWGNHRSHGHFIAKGGDINRLMDEIFCKSSGCSGGRGGSMHIFDKERGIYGTVPIVGGTIPIGVGAALTIKQNGTNDVSVIFLGDGATEEGHVIESMNLAALYNLPVLFVIENNHYSSHMHMSERRRQADLQKIGEMLGIPTIKVDGNLVNTVYKESENLISQLRKGEGPFIIECMTFRFRGHVGHRWDEDVGVKRKDELKKWLEHDPLVIERNTLLSKDFLERDLDKIDHEIKETIDDAVKKAREAPFPEDNLLEHVFVSR